jgi:hypothetical protein
MPLILVGIFVLLTSAVSEAGMVTTNILQRVFSLRTTQGSGTCFTIEVDDRQYLITAKHMLNTADTSNTVEILQNKEWVKLPFHRIEVEPNTVDIAVLALDRQISPLFPIQLGQKTAFLSQEVFFVGFPYGIAIDGSSLNSGFPIPLVKHGIIAGLDIDPGDPFIVDGINNPGFSGGPVTLGESPSNPRLIGVVSGYRFEQKPVFQHDLQTNLSVRENSGLLFAFKIDYAIEAIRKNPIGFSVKTSASSANN